MWLSELLQNMNNIFMAHTELSSDRGLRTLFYIFRASEKGCLPAVFPPHQNIYRKFAFTALSTLYLPKADFSNSRPKRILESMKNLGAVAMLPSRITSLYSERLSYNRDTNWRICPVVRYSGLQFWSVTNNAHPFYSTASAAFWPFVGRSLR